jgi:hypothetical protein
MTNLYLSRLALILNVCCVALIVVPAGLIAGPVIGIAWLHQELKREWRRL